MILARTAKFFFTVISFFSISVYSLDFKEEEYKELDYDNSQSFNQEKLASCLQGLNDVALMSFFQVGDEASVLKFSSTIYRCKIPKESPKSTEYFSYYDIPGSNNKSYIKFKMSEDNKIELSQSSYFWQSSSTDEFKQIVNSEKNVLQCTEFLNEDSKKEAFKYLQRRIYKNYIQDAISKHFLMYKQSLNQEQKSNISNVLKTNDEKAFNGCKSEDTFNFCIFSKYKMLEVENKFQIYDLQQKPNTKENLEKIEKLKKNIIDLPKQISDFQMGGFFDKKMTDAHREKMYFCSSFKSILDYYYVGNKNGTSRPINNLNGNATKAF